MYTSRHLHAAGTARRRSNSFVSQQSEDSLRPIDGDERAYECAYKATSSTPPWSPVHRLSTFDLEIVEQGSEAAPLLHQLNEAEELSVQSLSTIDGSDDDQENALDDLEEDNQEFPSIECTLSFEELPKSGDKRRFRIEAVDPDSYYAGRQMTPMQERMNAITVVPTFVYSFFLLLSGAWLDEAYVNRVREEIMMTDETLDVGGACINSTWFPNLHAMPPLPVLAAAVGIILHAPFSFIYHYFYAHRLTGSKKFNHWSRRMDQAMIHVISASFAYATSGSLDFFLANLLYNVDCIYRQFQSRVRPRSNKVRIYISILAYFVPLVRRAELDVLVKLFPIYAISGWFFAMYPIGGWSHSIFHLVIALAPPIIMSVAGTLPASQDQLRVAAICAVQAESL